MKIIGTDNHDRERVADILWLDGISNDPISVALAKRVCDRLNRNLGDHVGTWYHLVEDEVRLSRGMADLV
jgi:hypothetical protein